MNSKRAVDIILGSIALGASAPVLVAVAVCMRLTGDRGPFLYGARRVGEGGRSITVLRIRTMGEGSRGSGLTTHNDPRITRVGHLLRSHRIDDLPQLINVMRGEMSLVGPRPEDPEFVNLADPLHRRVFMAKPGITGLAQLEFWDEARLFTGTDSERLYREQIRPAKLVLDAKYLDEHSTWLDLRILARTIRAIAVTTTRPSPGRARRSRRRPTCSGPAGTPVQALSPGSGEPARSSKRSQARAVSESRASMEHPPAMAVGDRPRVVWFVNQYAGSPSHGMEFRHYELGRELAALRYRVVIISGSYSHLFTHRPRTAGTYTVEEVGGLTYCWVKLPAYRRSMSLGRLLNMLVFMARLYRLPSGRLPVPDAIVVSSPSLFPILPADRWARRWRARLVFEVRDVWPLSLQELGGLCARHPLVAFMGWFEDRAYRVADDVVSVFPAAGPHYAAHGLASSKLHVIPNGASPDALLEPSGPAPARVLAATAGSGFTVGFVGTLGIANALETLIEAARLLATDDIRFVIVGQGSEEGRLRAMASGLTNIAFVGPVAKAEVPATLREFDVCYIGYHRSPLYRFGISSNKIYDYMAAARPIILAAEAANDWVRDARCGSTIPPDDPGALADAIRSVRALPAAERAQLGANGRAFVQREHAYASLAARYVTVFEGTHG